MKKRFRTKLNNAIELTSLLDVIFIVLMVVICSQQSVNSTIRKEAEESGREAAAMLQQAEDLKAEAESDLVLYKDQLSSYAELDTQLALITVYVDYKPSDIKNRNIRIMVNGVEQAGIPVGPSNAAQSYQKLKEQLSGVLSEYEKKPVILSIDESQILYRDEEALRSLIDEMSPDYPNLYLKASGGDNE